MTTDEHLAEVIKGLRCELRAVYVRACMLRQSLQEIAAALGISERRVDDRMKRAISLCHTRLEARGIDLAPRPMQGGG
jgi:DNA-directed RNA polymerase specialized sigma24 family protein